ncbi:hypothetical protein F2Q70_00042797 [Brassica cretica]|uniref:Uncharacterized protein n=1 Tax=Brassica cretica TaxID=69181 RepID=A0A8S9KIF5_BRACR|nr:hypothetical protein F2Q70_00042797 [Brassica cretica]
MTSVSSQLRSSSAPRRSLPKPATILDVPPSRLNSDDPRRSSVPSQLRRSSSAPRRSLFLFNVLSLSSACIQLSSSSRPDATASATSNSSRSFSACDPIGTVLRPSVSARLRS